MSYCAHGFGRCPTCDEVASVAVLIEIQSIMVQAFGGNLDGSERGPLVSSHYLARIRDRLLGIPTVRPGAVCADCIDLRVRLVNIYHLTLTGGDAGETVRAVRAASQPGAPAPAPRGSHA